VTQEPPLPSIDLLARHEEKLTGVRFDPSLLAPSRLDYATSLAVQRISTGERQDVELPDNSEGIRPIGRFGRDVEIWELEPSSPSLPSSSSPSVVAVASVPVNDEIPLSYDACSRHPRKFYITFTKRMGLQPLLTSTNERQ